jgi:uncharacterized membrane protein YhaH (DUF805 family)
MIGFLNKFLRRSDLFSTFFGVEGRIGRGGWWFAQFLVFMVLAVWLVIAVMFGKVTGEGQQSADKSVSGIELVFLVSAIVLGYVINVCSTVKRYHDRGKSGWWFFIAFVPFIGGIWQLIECGFCSGEDGDNEYGSPPGAARNMANLEREVTSMRGVTIAQVNDDYSQKPTLNPAQQLPAMRSFANGKPVFGKR